MVCKLLQQRGRQLDPGDAEPGDQDVTEALPGRLLRFKRLLELLFGDQAVLDEDVADEAGGGGCCGVHAPRIGNPSFEL